MKELKDYLHLYLGCNVCITQDWYASSGGFKYLQHNEHKLTAGLLDMMLWDNHAVKAKLILRPLSDMTEEEYQTLSVEYYGRPWELTESKEDFFKKGDRNFSDADLYNDCAMGMVYLLSRGFDLFGLIESGLAIDKTKLNHPHQ